MMFNKKFFKPQLQKFNSNHLSYGMKINSQKLIPDSQT